jgi:hypothetical protein
VLCPKAIRVLLQHFIVVEKYGEIWRNVFKWVLSDFVFFTVSGIISLQILLVFVNNNFGTTKIRVMPLYLMYLLLLLLLLPAFTTHLRVLASSFLRFRDHTQWHNTVGRTPLDEGSAHRRDLYLTTHNTHNKHPCPRWDSNPQSQQASGCRPTP